MTVVWLTDGERLEVRESLATVRERAAGAGPVVQLVVVHLDGLEPVEVERRRIGWFRAG